MKKSITQKKKKTVKSQDECGKRDCAPSFTPFLPVTLFLPFYPSRICWNCVSVLAFCTPRKRTKAPPPWERNNTFIKQNGRQDSVNLFPSTVQVVPIATRKIYCFFRRLNPLYLYKIDHVTSYLFSPIIFPVPSILSQSNAFIFNSWCTLKIVKISSAWIFYTKRKVLDFVRGKWNLNIFWRYVAALDVFRGSKNKMILNALARTGPLLRAQLLCPRLVAVADTSVRHAQACIPSALICWFLPVMQSRRAWLLRNSQ